MGDFDRDGKTDWVVANGWDDNLWLYKGNGDGTSALVTILPLKGSSPIWVATADLRKTGRSDILVAEHDSNSIGVLLSNGDGTFETEQTLAVPNPDFVTAADVNGDGSPDIVAGAAGCAFVLMGNGQGAFQSAIQSCAPPNSPQAGYPAPSFTTFITFADFNKDGKLDILMSNPEIGVGMLTGDGTGHFGSPIELAVENRQIGYYFFTSAALDFNGDGCPDAAMGDVEGKVFLFAGDCAGNFKHPAAIPLDMGDVPAQLSVADVNGDGHPDLVASGMVSIWGQGASSGRLLMVALADGQGGFQHSQVYRAGDSLVGFAVGDLNGDGKPDVLAVAQNEDSLYEFLNDGSGNFGAPQGRAQLSMHGIHGSETYSYNDGVDSLPLFGDVNGDGRTDVVYIDSAVDEKTWSVAASLNLGTQGFADPIYSTINTNNTFIASNVLGDFHGNGKPDLVVTTDPGQPGGPGNVPGQVYLMQNLGGGRFGLPVAIYPHSNAGTSTFAVDLNKDGKLDLLIADIWTTPQLSVLLGNGDGTFRAPVTYSLPISGNTAYFYANDFNGDGKLDVLLYLAQNVTPCPADVVELFGNGDGTLQPPTTLFGTPGINPFALVDLNHDGRPDIVTTSGTAVETYFGQRDGTFSGPQIYTSLTDTYELDTFPVAADFDQDGNTDVLVPSQQFPAGSSFWWAQFYTASPTGTLNPTADVIPIGEVKPKWMTATMAAGEGASLVEFNNTSLSFDVLPGTTAPPFQLVLDSEAIVGGTISGAVVLNQTASTDTTVSLHTSDPALIGPNSVLIGAGSTSANFTFHVSTGINVFQVAAITGTLGSFSATAYAFDEAAITAISVAAPHLDFGVQLLNTPSAPLMVTVANNTASPLTLNNIIFNAVTGFANPDFTETDNCHAAIAPQAVCSFNVIFKPTSAVGGEVTQLDFTDPASGQQYKYFFTGTPGYPAAQLGPASLTFSAQTVGTKSTFQTAFLYDTGTISLNVSSTTVTGPFQIQNSCATVPVGTPCQILIVYAPTAAGPQTGVLTVTSNGSASPLTVSLSGTGIAIPTAALSPSSLNFPAALPGTTSTSQAITLNNTGTSALTIYSITTGFPFSQTDNCSSSLAPGASCQINVQFVAPSTNPSAGVLSINDNGVASPQQASLAGQSILFAINSTISTLTISSGGSATFPLTVSETAAYPESITLACIGAPPYATCTVNPVSVSLSNTTPVATSLSINTTSTVAYLPGLPARWKLSTGILASLWMPLFAFKWKRFRLGRMIPLSFVLAIASCGGASQSAGSGGGVRTTPPGTYNITVTGTATGVSIQKTVMLVIQ